MSSRTQTVTASSLAAYLNDHLAGSTAAIELVTRLRVENEGTPLGDMLARLATEVDADRSTLQDIMARLDIRPHRSKRAAAWVTEKVGRVRFIPLLTGNADTSRLIQLETLLRRRRGKAPVVEGVHATFQFRLPSRRFRPRPPPGAGRRRSGDLIEPFRLLEAAAAGLG